MTNMRLLIVAVVALLVAVASPASAHMKLIFPGSVRGGPSTAQDDCCAESNRDTTMINNFQCDIGNSMTTTRASATGQPMREGVKYNLVVHLAVNHRGTVYHGIEDYTNNYPDTSAVTSYSRLAEITIDNTAKGEYDNEYILELGTACTNCGWWAWYDTETAPDVPRTGTWTSCSDITVQPVDFPLHYNINADTTGTNTPFPATNPPTMTGQFYVNTPMPDILQNDNTVLPANENQIKEVRYTLQCPTGVTHSQCGTDTTPLVEIDSISQPFGTSATAYNADTLPNGEYTISSEVYFELRDRADNDLGRYRTYTGTFIVARDISCANPLQLETTPTAYTCDPSAYLPKAADAATLNCGPTPCTPDICCDPRQRCDTFITDDAPGCTPETNTPKTTPAPADILCEGTTCTATECCDSNQQCGTYTCPDTHVRPIVGSTNTVCQNLACETAECCQLNEICQNYTCEAGMYHPRPGLALTTPCPVTGVCGSDNCCDRNPSCELYVCPDNAIQKVADAANVYCSTSVCQVSECCGQNQRCNESPGLCISGESTMKPAAAASIQCRVALCDAEDCCDPNPLCSSYTCPSDAVTPVTNTATKVCGTDLCESLECCIPNRLCTTHGCSTGMTALPESDRIQCTNDVCTDTQCCQPNQTCDQYFGCQRGTMSPLQTAAPADIVCVSLMCTAIDCCEPNPSCVGFSCPPLMITNLPNPQDITCRLDAGAGSGCLNDECCQANPTCAAFDCTVADDAGVAYLTPADKDVRVCAGADCGHLDCCELAYTCGNKQGTRTTTAAPIAFICGSRGDVDNFDNVVCTNMGCDASTCCQQVAGITPLTGSITRNTRIIPPGGTGVRIVSRTGGRTIVVGTSGTTVEPSTPIITGAADNTGIGNNDAAAANGTPVVPIDATAKDDDDSSGTVVGIIVVLLLLCCLLLAGLLYRKKRKSSEHLLEFTGVYRDVHAESAHQTKGVAADDDIVLPTDAELVAQMAVASSSSESESEPSIVSSSSSDGEVEEESDSSSDDDVFKPEPATTTQRPDRPAPLMKKKMSVKPNAPAPKLKKRPSKAAPKLKRGPQGAAPVMQKKIVAVGAGESAAPTPVKAAIAAGGGGAAPQPTASVGIGAGGGGGGAVDGFQAGIGAGGGGGGPAPPPTAPVLAPAKRSSVQKRTSVQSHRGQGRAGRGGRKSSIMVSHLSELAPDKQTPVVNTVVSVMPQEFMDLIKGMGKKRNSDIIHDGSNAKSAEETRATSQTIS